MHLPRSGIHPGPAAWTRDTWFSVFPGVRCWWPVPPPEGDHGNKLKYNYMQGININWFAAKTRYGQEVGIKERLEKMGIEHFIPTEDRKNARGNITRRAMIPNLVFVRDTKVNACNLKATYGLPLNYMFDHATHLMLVVPDKQMDDFQRVFSQGLEDGGLMDIPVGLGDGVRVKRGALKGVEGHVLELQGKSYVVVGLCGCLFARARVPRAWLEKLP